MNECLRAKRDCLRADSPPSPPSRPSRRPSHARACATTRLPSPCRSAASFVPPATGRPSTCARTVCIALPRLAHSSSSAALATVARRGRPPPLASRRAAGSRPAPAPPHRRVPTAGQCRASRAAAATRAHARRSVWPSTRPGSRARSQRARSPLGCFEGGVSVWQPVERSSISMVGDGAQASRRLQSRRDGVPPRNPPTRVRSREGGGWRAWWGMGEACGRRAGGS